MEKLTTPTRYLIEVSLSVDEDLSSQTVQEAVEKALDTALPPGFWLTGAACMRPL